MKGPSRYVVFAAVAASMLTACAPAAGRPDAGGVASDQQPRQPRTLVFITRQEPDDMSMGGTAGTHDGTAIRLFHGNLVMLDDRQAPFPYLAAALPQLNTDSWRVFPEGKMETIYRLKPNLVWHDGVPFTAEDLVFTWRVRSDPSLGKSAIEPQNLMEEIVAPDARTAVIRWKQPFPGGGTVGIDFRPLPRHILESVYAQGSPDAFANHPYFTSEFVGLGAFRMEKRELGVGIEGAAFDRFVFGRPKIDHVRVIVMSDPNTVVANILSGNAHMVSDSTLRFQSGDLLQKEWQARGGGGSAYFSPAQVRYAELQSKPEVASPKGILDPRVRKAIAHAVDTKELSDALYQGKGVSAVTLAQLNSEQYALIDRSIAKYPFDMRRSEQFMADAGYTKGADGVYTHPIDGRFTPEWRATSGGDSETQVTVLSDMLKRAGMDARPYILPQIQGADAQVRASFPTLSNTSTTGSSEDWPRRLIKANIATPENRWQGSNRGGWTTPEYEALYGSYATSLNSSERDQLLARLMTIISEEMAIFPMYYLLDVTAHVSAVQAPRLVGADGSIAWNVQEWELR